MRIFDCFLYNGEIDVLLLRLHELHDVVDAFVVVEATRTFSGNSKPLHLRAQWALVKAFAPKIRYVVVADDIGEREAWDREHFQRNRITQGLRDAAPDDLVCLSDVDEIPRSVILSKLREGRAQPLGFKLDFSYFFLNYRNTAGPEAALAWNCAFPKSLLAVHAPEELRHGIRNGSIPARHIDKAGWHFSYLSDLAGIKKKISDFSNQEFNNPAFLDSIDIEKIVERRGDFFSRPGFVWGIGSTDDLPRHVQQHPDLYKNKILASSALRRWWARRRRPILGTSAPKKLADLRPVILCPYVHEADRKIVETAFGVNEDRGRNLPFFFWQDTQLIGPERAYEHCWNQFPDRDVIIIHTDMRPMPDDLTNDWYLKLCAQVEALPSAGIVACDLLYPLHSPNHRWYVQCAGGLITDGRVHHIGGGVDLEGNTATADAFEYDDRYAKPRSVRWVTFGGVYVRREVIDMVGQLDRRYEWAYWMDVDYCLETWLRGQDMYQVPVNLLHEESKTSKSFMSRPEYARKFSANMEKFYEKWQWQLAPENEPGHA